MNNNIDINEIKLIVWDLDETFWDGTLAEDGIVKIPSLNKQLVIDLAYRGIISSICSKNEKKQVESILKKEGLNSFFVFNSINWESKGPRVASLISNMNLRDKNVLFIDDNKSNLAEVKAFCPNIIVSLPPNCIDVLIEFVKTSEISDPSLDRLMRYKVLEQKTEEQLKSDNIDTFLKKSKIRISIHNNCLNEAERIFELINRTNQLNYTKIRLTKEETIRTLEDTSLSNGYIKCKDKYGYYGIVGFFSLEKENNVLKHFCFSCRTMGMRLESFIYNYLGCPTIDIRQPVSKDLIANHQFDYIKIVDEIIEKKTKHNKDYSVLLRGPCDLEALSYYLENNSHIFIEKELAYVGKHGVSLYQIGHSQVICDSAKWSHLDMPFVENKMYETSLFKKKYDMVVISTLTEAQYGIYYFKKERRKLVYGEAWRSAFDNHNKADFQNGFPDIIESDYSILKKELDFLGRIGIEDSVTNYLNVVNNLPSTTKIVILLGPEQKVNREANNSIRELDGNLFYKELNMNLTKAFKNYKNVYLVHPKIKDYRNRFFKFPSSTHYDRKTYYYLAKDIKRISKGKLNVSFYNRFRDIIYSLLRR